MDPRLRMRDPEAARNNSLDGKGLHEEQVRSRTRAVFESMVAATNADPTLSTLISSRQ